MISCYSIIQQIVCTKRDYCLTQCSSHGPLPLLDKHLLYCGITDSLGAIVKTHREATHDSHQGAAKYLLPLKSFQPSICLFLLSGATMNADRFNIFSLEYAAKHNKCLISQNSFFFLHQFKMVWQGDGINWLKNISRYKAWRLGCSLVANYRTFKRINCIKKLVTADKQ